MPHDDDEMIKTEIYMRRVFICKWTCVFAKATHVLDDDDDDDCWRREEENIFNEKLLTWVCKHESWLFAILIMPPNEKCVRIKKIIFAKITSTMVRNFHLISFQSCEGNKSLVKINKSFEISMSFLHCVKNSKHN